MQLGREGLSSQAVVSSCKQAACHKQTNPYLIAKAAVDSAAFQNILELLLEALNYLKRGQVQCNLDLGFCC